jgi:hypothetical protein
MGILELVHFLRCSRTSLHLVRGSYFDQVEVRLTEQHFRRIEMVLGTWSWFLRSLSA